MSSKGMLSVVIVVYSEYELVDRCLSAVERQLPPHSQVILVHNNSGKAGIDTVLHKHPQVEYIFSQHNLGFGNAVNLGFKQARAEFVLVLTPDIVLLPNTIAPTLAYIAQRRRIGLVTCPLITSDGQLSRSTFKGFPNLWSHLLELNLPLYKLVHKLFADYVPHLQPLSGLRSIHYPDHVVGAYMLLRKKAVNQINGFAAEYFLYREETDLCKRLGQAGWGIAYLPTGGVIHTADGAVHQRLSQASHHYLRSTYLFFGRHYSQTYALTAFWLGYISSWLSVQLLAISHRKDKQLIDQWRQALNFHKESA